MKDYTCPNVLPWKGSYYSYFSTDLKQNESCGTKQISRKEWIDGKATKTSATIRLPIKTTMVKYPFHKILQYMAKYTTMCHEAQFR